jgi:hypothetical protein
MSSPLEAPRYHAPAKENDPAYVLADHLRIATHVQPLGPPLDTPGDLLDVAQKIKNKERAGPQPSQARPRSGISTYSSRTRACEHGRSPRRASGGRQRAAQILADRRERSAQRRDGAIDLGKPPVLDGMPFVADPRETVGAHAFELFDPRGDLISGGQGSLRHPEPRCDLAVRHRPVRCTGLLARGGRAAAGVASSCSTAIARPPRLAQADVNASEARIDNQLSAELVSGESSSHLRAAHRSISQAGGGPYSRMGVSGGIQLRQPRQH